MESFIILTSQCIYNSNVTIQKLAFNVENISCVIDVRNVNHTPENEATKILLKNGDYQYVFEPFEKVMELIEKISGNKIIENKEL